jgi:hypothetical protein
MHRPSMTSNGLSCRGNNGRKPFSHLTLLHACWHCAVAMGWLDIGRSILDSVKSIVRTGLLYRPGHSNAFLTPDYRPLASYCILEFEFHYLNAALSLFWFLLWVASPTEMFWDKKDSFLRSHVFWNLRDLNISRDATHIVQTMYTGKTGYGF